MKECTKCKPDNDMRNNEKRIIAIEEKIESLSRSISTHMNMISQSYKREVSLYIEDVDRAVKTYEKFVASNEYTNATYRGLIREEFTEIKKQLDKKINKFW